MPGPGANSAALLEHVVTDTRDPFSEYPEVIPFPPATIVRLVGAERRDDEWPESSFLYLGIVDANATAVEVVGPRRIGFLSPTGWEDREELTYFQCMFGSPSLEQEQVEVAASFDAKTLIGRRLEEARRVLGVTVDDIASASHVARATLFAWANGTTEPRPPSRRGMDRIFGITSVAVQILGLNGARDWFQFGVPSRASLVLRGRADSVAAELDAFVSATRRSTRAARREEADKEPEHSSEGW